MKSYRGYIISPNPFSPTLYQVAVEGQGGSIPKVLGGSFTSVGAIQEIIDKYVSNKEEEQAANVRKTSLKK